MRQHDSGSRPRQRFRAKVLKQGVNSYVDVPERVSRAFEAFGTAGRIGIIGKLNDTEIRASLVPVGKGRHRLFLHGGMRAAAGVDIGDAVSLELTPVRPGQVVIPGDLVSALRRRGATRSFRAQTAARQRQTIRFIDDAKTPTLRERRIDQSVDDLLGRTAGVDRRRPERPLWTCPRCGNEFVTRNMYHSCARHTLDEPFEGKPAFVRELFDRLRAIVEDFGPVKLVVYGNRVAFMDRARFAGASPKTRWLQVEFWVRRRLESPRLKTEMLSPTAYVCTTRVERADQLDRELTEWLRESYLVGQQK